MRFKPDDMTQADFVAACDHVTKLLAQALQRFGGSISAEHGIGLVKKAYLWARALRQKSP